MPSQLPARDALRLLFADRADEAWLCHFKGDPAGGAWFGGRAKAQLDALAADDNVYVARCLLQHGARRRTLTQAESVGFLVLDDIGPKGDGAAARALLGPPTWRALTSPGNEQWVYRYDRQETDLRLDSAVMHALAARGLTDGGSLDATRYLRLPCGVNGKPAYAGHEVRLVELNPDARINLTDLAMELDADPASVPEPVTHAGGEGTADLEDISSDLYLQALDALGMVKGVIKPGVIDITCPFIDRHTQRVDTGTAYFGRGKFKCHHSCPDDSGAFQAEILRCWGEADPAALETAQHAEAARAFDGTLTPEGTDAVVERFREAREALGAWAQVARDWVYVKGDKRCVELANRTRSFERIDFNIEMARLVEFGASGRDGEAEAFKTWINHPDTRQLDGVTYAAGQPAITSDNRLNLWQPSRLVPRKGAGEADVEPWLRLLRYIIPDDETRLYVLDAMAFILQQPGAKLSVCILLLGAQGIGKDLVLKPLLEAVGMDNVALIDNATLRDSFHEYLLSQVIVMSEIAAGPERYALYAMLKSRITATHLAMNRKGLPRVQIPSRHAWFALTNDENAVPLAHDDRRFFVVKSDVPPLPAEDYDSLVSWYTTGGYEKVAGYLIGRKISATFNPERHPRIAAVAQAKAEMGLAAHGIAGQWIEETFGHRRLLTVPEIQNAAIGRGLRDLHPNGIAEILRLLGGRRLGKAAKRLDDSGKKRWLWALTQHELFENMTETQLAGQYNKDRGGFGDPR